MNTYINTQYAHMILIGARTAPLRPSVGFSNVQKRTISVPHRQCRLLVASASENSSAYENDRPSIESLLKSLSGDEQIGAEYGEGFLQFRTSGERVRLDVDSLNELLSISGADRMRHAMHPDEAFGLIFSWDDVIVDARALARDAWRHVAASEGLPFPSIERPHMFDMRPERAAMDVLHWTRDMRRAQEIAWLVATEYAKGLRHITAPLPGVVEWLAVMSKTNVPCALVTSMDRTTATDLLKRLDLRHFFSALVTADDDMDSLSQKYLSAALKLGRPPNQCIVFGGSPPEVAAAHNCTMRAVALMGPHTAPQLRAADLTIGSMTELTVYNLRRLFANRGSEFMDLRKGRVGQGPRQRHIKHATAEGPRRDELEGR